MTDIPTLALTHGARIPQLGLGTWPLEDHEAEEAVAAALGMGYRLVDTAYAYGNEIGVGRGIRAAGIPRGELFVTSKLNGEWHGYSESQAAFEDSCERLGLDYLDLYLIHWPLPAKDRFVDAWKGLAKLLENGNVRAIGMSNFKPAHLERLITETGITPDVNQIQLNPTLTRDASRSFNADHGIVTQSWSPIGTGGDLLSLPVVRDIARAHDRTPAQVVLRWHVQLGLVPIPKSASPARLLENITIFDFELNEREMSALSALDSGEAAAVDSDSFGH